MRLVLAAWTSFTLSLLLSASAEKHGGVVEPSPFEKLCTVLNGDANVEYQCGHAYLSGDGVPHDANRGLHWFIKAADDGSVDAAELLAGLYYTGWPGVPQNYAQSAFWYRRAAERGDAQAQYELGYMHQYGLGVPQDYTQAEVWYQRAANSGNESGRVSLTAIQDQIAAITEARRKRTQGLFIAGSGIVFALGFASVLIRFRKRLLAFSKGLLPQTPRMRKLAVLLVVGCWCSACCLSQALNPAVMRHPISATATALLFSAPAVIFGAVSLWWLSQPPKRG